MAGEGIYSPLPKHSHIIRLLDVTPGRWDDALECYLREIPLAEVRGLYTTISYTWGSIDEGTRQCFITCNSQQVTISENLYAVLRRLRRPDYSIPLWCDALCINQASADERTHQVGLMGDIYRHSRETVIWLGEQTEADDMGDRFLSMCMTEDDFNVVKMGGPPRLAWKNDFRDSGLLSAYLHDYQRFENSEPLRARRALQMKGILPFNDMFGAMCLLFALARGTSSLAIEFLEDGFSDLQGKSTKDTDLPFLAFQSSSSRSATALAGLEKLMSRPWWSRIWVIQETVLARNATIHYGMLSAPWKMFADAATHFMWERHTLCLDLSGNLRGSESLNIFSSTVLRIENTRRHLQQGLTDATLLSLLWKFRSQESSDKRDKVYALLGLTTNWKGGRPMYPDYALGVSDTFLRTALDIIRRSASLSVLAGEREPRLGRQRTKDLPSWVMDWSLPCLQLEIDRVSSLAMYDASGGRKGPLCFHVEQSILEAEGTHIDDVETVGPITRHTQISDTLAVIRQWKLTMLHVASKHSRYPSGCTYVDAFWRTLLGDVVHTGQSSGGEASFRRATSGDFAAYEAWRMWSRCISRDTINRAATFTQRDLDEGISSIDYALRTATASRTFFLTRKGYMGIGPKTTKPGDRLYVLKSSNVPFLMRPHSLRSCTFRMPLVNEEGGQMLEQASIVLCGGTHNCHSLVGDCFAYGLMDGEAFKIRDADPKSVFLV